jgi:hypothetical protein
MNPNTASTGAGILSCALELIISFSYGSGGHCDEQRRAVSSVSRP